MVYKIKRFAKVWMNEGWKDVSDLNDKQLENVAKYSEDRNQQKNAMKVYRKLGRLSTIAGAGIGYADSNSLRGASKGAVIGGLLGYGTGVLAHNHHRHNAKAARKELNKRRSFPAHLDGKDEKGRFIRKQVGTKKNGEPIWGEKIYDKRFSEKKKKREKLSLREAIALAASRATPFTGFDHNNSFIQHNSFIHNGGISQGHIDAVNNHHIAMGIGPVM